MKNTNTHYLHRSSRLFTAVIILIALLGMSAAAHEIDQTSRVIWPDLIPLPVGFEPEGIESTHALYPFIPSRQIAVGTGKEKLGADLDTLH